MQRSFSYLVAPKIHHQNFHLTKKKKISSWTSAIKKASSPQEALNLYKQMQNQSIPFDSYSILFTIKSCTHFLPNNLSLIRHLHAHLFKIGFNSHVYVATSLLYAYVISSFEDARLLFDEMPEKNAVTFNTMITGYSMSRDIESARLIFNEIPSKDLASYSAMISGYLSNGSWDKGLTLFREMIVNEPFKPDQITLVSILSGCTRMGSLGLLLGKSIHSFIEKNEWEMNVELGTVLVDMYTKCGFLKGASQIFERMKERNVMSWSVMICGLANHGYGEEALSIFEKMEEAGIKPNEITFTGILSACTHAGLIDKGKKYFEKMIQEYKIKPRIQHYGCMVDLLGKGGRLEEAYEVIESMKLEPNVVIWSSLLAACKVHKRFEMAEKVIERVLMVVKPESDGGVYTLISDLYSLNGKWEKAQWVRELMVNQNVKKVRGSSFIRTTGTT
ncbi:Pentatricopeptide repeat [Macleaya cordata]|uniref:Pentatricopeptide repeat n=1 Tax=Macleaya cordata TaxID=56857 RepID=A0A200PTN3_MACCD|nr:Pentatricopeptide repeat [Macleaya cordata]